MRLAALDRVLLAYSSFVETQTLCKQRLLPCLLVLPALLMTTLLTPRTRLPRPLLMISQNPRTRTTLVPRALLALLKVATAMMRNPTPRTRKVQILWFYADLMKFDRQF